MIVNVLGAGSVGLGVAATLARAGAQVTLVTRGESLQTLRAKGIHVTGVLGEYTVSPKDFSAADAMADPAGSIGTCDFIVVATKTYEVAPALKALLPSLKMDKPPALLLLQNGWGSADEAKQVMPVGTPLFSASVMTGFERIAPAHVKINAHADVMRAGSLFGDDPGIIQSLCDVSKRGFIPIAYEPEIEPVLLAKLIYNICLNPLGALMRCTYGELIANEHTLGLMERLADEAVKTLAAVRGFSRYASGEKYVHGELIPKWFPKVEAHRSSMLQDIETGRRTEIRYLNGAIPAMGRPFGIETPCNDNMVELILGAERIHGTARAQASGAVAWQKRA